MRVFLSILILIFSFQSFTNADDITEFEIEGISIGNSLLKYLSKNQILRKIESYPDKGFIYKSKDYYALTFDAEDFVESKFDQYQFHLKNNDNDYVIYAIAGIKLFDNIKNCYPLMDEIHDELKSLFNFSNTEPIDYKNRNNKTSNKGYWLDFDDGSNIYVACEDWTEESNIADGLALVLNDKTFQKWVDTKAYQ